ncbi:hypothetical protein HMPREF0742_02689 [Rothia aeria F0184]|uniref:Uncharacterized protein n=1 Tax=Rothia aeria F0184 TaxID=888019 RepID=U7UVY9_9MICC|nr:hypothetical protein HMPREF0742_02689 [Rothia aeria F0184]
MKVPNAAPKSPCTKISLSKLQNEGSQHPGCAPNRTIKSIKATE